MRDPIKPRIAAYWQSAEPGFVPDLSMPRCFACGFDRLKDWPETSDPVVIRRRWESASFLEAAHIIADSIGGAKTVDNLLLLCKRCHIEAPMLNRRELMLDWVRNRPHVLDYWIAETLAGLQGLELPANIDWSGFVPFLKYLKIDRHPHQPAGSLPSSLVLAVKDYVSLHQARFIFNPQQT